MTRSVIVTVIMTSNIKKKFIKLFKVSQIIMPTS